MKRKLRSLTRLRNRYLFLLDGLVISASVVMALVIRLESIPAARVYAIPLVVYLLVITPVKLASLIRCNFYSAFWAHASIPEVLTMLRSVLCASAVEIAAVFFFLFPLDMLAPGFPRSVPFISSIVSILLIGGSRLGIRWLDSWVTRPEKKTVSRGVLIAGAGVAGTMTVKELLNNPQMGILPLGFLDDDPMKAGKRVHGVQVRGTLSDLAEVARAWKADEVIIAMPTAPGRVIREVVESCRAASIPSRTIPGLFDILRGTARVDQFRSVTLEDLLRRGAIHTDVTQVGAMVDGTRVLVTGAGGSIGSELCRQICDFHPKEILLLGHGENSIYRIASELACRSGIKPKITSVVADIRDRDRMEEVFRTHVPEIVFHAAAHKHVPLMEGNVSDAVTNNVLGTRNLVDLADKFGTRRFVMISSDKAVNPTSVMGVTKRIAELSVQEAARLTDKPFVVVRFGNVLGSRGSVVPLFQKQIAEGGPVTVTHPEMRRYFMTIPEAVQLVLQSTTMGNGGEVFVLDMGDQIRVADLARDLIRLSGLEEGRDIDIVYTGTRPGEKLYEELFYPDSPIERTAHEKLLVCRNGRHGDIGGNGNHTPLHESRLWLETDTLIEAARMGNEPSVQALFKRLVPQYVSPTEAPVFTRAPATVVP
jgi:FlaA1/EpsC-like NDP-sugar epimerase